MKENNGKVEITEEMETVSGGLRGFQRFKKKNFPKELTQEEKTKEAGENILRGIQGVDVNTLDRD